MLNCILQGFLYNSKQAKRDFHREGTGYIQVTEFNPYLVLLRQLFAVAIGCRHNAQIFELRGMETVGQGLNVLTNVRKTLTGVMDMIVKISRRLGKMLAPTFQLNRHQRDALIDIVMQLSGDPGALLLVGLNQPATHAGEALLCQFAIGDVEARADIAGKRAVRVESWHTYIGYPAVVSVVPPEPILHLERLPEIECLGVGIQATAQIFVVDQLCPAITKLCLKGPTSEL